MLQPIHGIRTISKDNIEELDHVLFFMVSRVLRDLAFEKGEKRCSYKDVSRSIFNIKHSRKPKKR